MYVTFYDTKFMRKLWVGPRLKLPAAVRQIQAAAYYPEGQATRSWARGTPKGQGPVSTSQLLPSSS